MNGTNWAVSSGPSNRATTFQRPPVACKQTADSCSGTAAHPCQMTVRPPRAHGGLPAPRSGTKTRRSAAPGHSLTPRVTQVHPNNVVYEEQRAREGWRIDLQTAARCSKPDVTAGRGGHCMVTQTELSPTCSPERSQSDLLRSHWARHSVSISSASLTDINRWPNVPFIHWFG